FTKYILLLFLAVVFGRSYAQVHYTGIIIDAATREPVANASVQVKNTSQGTATNNNGEFTLQLADTTQELVISSLGYLPFTLTGNPNQKSWLIPLQSNNNSLQEVVVSASRTAQKRSEAPVAIATISKQTMEETKATR